MSVVSFFFFKQKTAYDMRISDWSSDVCSSDLLPDHARPNLSWSLRISGVLLLLWLGPVAALLFAFGPDDVFSRIATFFSQMAVVTFGGAYAVQIGRAHVELQSLMRISYAVFCLKKKNQIQH